jgi:hypothetical protein
MSVHSPGTARSATSRTRADVVVCDCVVAMVAAINLAPPKLSGNDLRARGSPPAVGGPLPLRPPHPPHLRRRVRPVSPERPGRPGA